MTSELPNPPRRGSHAAGAGSGSQHLVLGSFASSLAILLGSALVGLAGGLAWGALAPRALYVVVGRGSADVVNPETTAFIAADGWYCLIGALGGILIGLAAYLLAVRRYGPAPMAAILAGSVVAGCLARWVGEHQGLHQFDQQLLTAHQGTLLHAPLGLAGDTAVTFWPTFASLPAVAFWPLAGCLVGGGIVFVSALRSRPGARAYSAGYAGPQQYTSYPGQQPGS
ncbi:MAG TPA: hypothetical protein VMU94_21360 [Streptosporangiaceae bacterium]|nr:hypothetical protein [Streptosporangiaceae bacterium]